MCKYEYEYEYDEMMHNFNLLSRTQYRFKYIDQFLLGN
jgi:hypothetical protein